MKNLNQSDKIALAIFFAAMIGFVVVFCIDPIAGIFLVFIVGGIYVIYKIIVTVYAEQPPVKTKKPASDDSAYKYYDQIRRDYERDKEYKKALDLMLDVKSGKAGIYISEAQRYEVQEHINRLLSIVWSKHRS